MENNHLYSHWFQRFEEIGILEEYEFLDGDLEYRGKQKDEFLSGRILNPTLDYPKINLEQLQERSLKLNNLKQEKTL